jgi:hypothetical protein
MRKTDMTTLLGALMVAAAGLLVGSGAWPFKLMRTYRFEHWWFVGMLVGLVIMPWGIMLACCRHVPEALGAVPWPDLLLGNFFALGWGIANVLCGLCFVRIGVALTGAILAGLGVSIGAIVPMVFKGSGLFKDSAGLGSPAGLAVLAGVTVILVGVVLAAVAGFGRDRELRKLQQTSGGFLGGLIMTAIAGVLSSFFPFAFVYSQDRIIANLSVVEPDRTIWVIIEGGTKEAHRVSSAGTIELKDSGTIAVGGATAADAAARIQERITATRPGAERGVLVETGSIPATFGAFAVCLAAGALLNVGYAAYLLTKNRSWNVFAQSGRELALAVIIGINMSVSFTLVGKGMLLLGALGASIGWGIQQPMQMTGSQLLGFVSGEWRGVHGKPRRQMYLAIAVLMVAALIMACGNTLPKAWPS